jgi:hypothetical protein
MEVLSAANVSSMKGVTYKVYPNPASDRFTFTSSTPLQDAVLSLIDVNGRVVSKFAVNGDSVVVSVIDMPAGLYKLVLNDKNNVFTFSILVK